MSKETTPKDEVRNVESYPGAAIDVADKEKTDEATVKERTHTLNNNPRNNDIDN